MGRTYAGVLGPIAFVTVLTRSLIGGGSADSTLSTAILCLFGFAALGFVVGQVAELVVWDAVRSRLHRELANTPATKTGRRTADEQG
jgi:hypothetical protein